MIILHFLFILFVVSFSLVQVSYADNNWKEINVYSPLDNKTKYIFYYNSEGIGLPGIGYANNLVPSLTFNTTQVTDKQAQIKAPKNFPTYLQHPWDIFTDMNSTYEHEENDCFDTYSINTINSTVLYFAYYTVPEADLSDLTIHTIPDYCLPHTIADYPHSVKTYENIRGEQVSVYLSSVLKLLERNYLVEAIN